MGFLRDARESTPQVNWNRFEITTGITGAGGQAYSMTGHCPEARRSMMYEVINALVSECGFTILATRTKSIPLTTISVAERQVSTVFWDEDVGIATDHDTSLTMVETGLSKTEGSSDWDGVDKVWWAAHNSTQCPWVLVRAPASMGSFELVFSLRTLDLGATAGAGNWFERAGTTFEVRMGEFETWHQGGVTQDGNLTPVPYGGKNWCFLTNQGPNSTNLTDAGVTNHPSYNGFGWTPYDSVSAVVRVANARGANNLAKFHQYLGMHCALIYDDDRKWCYLAFSCRIAPAPEFAWVPTGLWAFGKKPESGDGVRVPSWIDPSQYPSFKSFYGCVGTGQLAHNISEPLGTVNSLNATDASGSTESQVGDAVNSGWFTMSSTSYQGTVFAEYMMSSDQAMSGVHRTDFTGTRRLMNLNAPLVQAHQSEVTLVVRSISGKEISDLSDMPTQASGGMEGIDVRASHFTAIDMGPRENSIGDTNVVYDESAVEDGDYPGDLGSYAIPTDVSGLRNLVGCELLMACLDPYDRGDAFFMPDCYMVNKYDGFMRMRLWDGSGSWLRHGCFILPWPTGASLVDDQSRDLATYPTGASTYNLIKTADAGFATNLPATM